MREYLIDIRNSKGFTQKYVSERLGVSESYYSLIEHGERQKDMNVLTLHKLSKIFKVSTKSLLDKELDFINKRVS